MKMNPWHVGIAAEAYAAALFARCGLDVSVQYGANQPEYDLAVIRGERMMKVSVKGSQDGGWGLSQSYLKKGKADYHAAADAWTSRHKPKTVLCLVQFMYIPLDQMPRVYLATPIEIASYMKQSDKGRGVTIVWENKVWTKTAKASGTVDRIPAHWAFSPERVEQLLLDA